VRPGTLGFSAAISRYFPIFGMSRAIITTIMFQNSEKCATRGNLEEYPGEKNNNYVLEPLRHSGHSGYSGLSGYSGHSGHSGHSQRLRKLSLWGRKISKHRSQALKSSISFPASLRRPLFLCILLHPRLALIQPH
jgi:hypothetical protein